MVRRRRRPLTLWAVCPESLSLDLETKVKIGVLLQREEGRLVPRTEMSAQNELSLIFRI